jgi:hypothetical protein
LNARLTADLTYQQALVEDLSAQIALFKARDSETSKRVADERDAFEKDRLSWYERESQLLQEAQRLQAKYEERMLRMSGALNEVSFLPVEKKIGTGEFGRVHLHKG